MKIIRIRYVAGRTVPHPSRQYHMLRPEVEFVAELEPEDDPNEVAADLRRQAEVFINQTVTTMIRSLAKDPSE